jgi:hypothetical protein
MRHYEYLRLGWSAVLGVVVVLSPASAQVQPGAATQPDTVQTVDADRKVKLTPEEHVKQAEEILGRIDSAAGDVRKKLSKAREDRDVVKALCLDDKLNQIDVARRSAGERQQAIRDAAARQDADLSAHEYTILVVLKDLVSQLSAEANQCIGVEAGFVGDATVTVDIDPNLPQEDASEYPQDPVIVTPPPACASCVQ